MTPKGTGQQESAKTVPILRNGNIAKNLVKVHQGDPARTADCATSPLRRQENIFKRKQKKRQ